MDTATAEFPTLLQVVLLMALGAAAQLTENPLLPKPVLLYDSAGLQVPMGIPSPSAPTPMDQPNCYLIPSLGIKSVSIFVSF